MGCAGSLSVAINEEPRVILLYNPYNTVMILCCRDYAAESDYDFKWNEFEEATVVADSYDDFLRRVMSGEIVL